MKTITKISIILLLTSIFSFGVLSTHAEPLLNANSGDLNKTSACMTNGSCELNDFTRVAINVTKIILGIVGSLALLAFVAGGLMMMLSAGNPEWVTRGKQTLIGAVVGLVIVFTSYAIIQLVFTSLGIDAAKSGAWSTIGAWFK